MKGIGEFRMMLETLAVPFAIAVIFPYCAIGFSAARTPPARDDSRLEIVFLDEGAERSAVRLAKGPARENHGGGETYAELLGVDLPAETVLPVVPADMRIRPPALPIAQSGVPAFLPSQRAAAPVRIVPDPPDESAPFSRSELLKLD